jgi:hypothetical protein
MSEAQEPVEEVVEEVKEPEQEGPDISGLMFDFPGSPSKEQIEDWKGVYGDVFCTGFSEVELYVFRPLNRAEWIVLQIRMQEQKNEVDLEQEVVNQCLLWCTDIGRKALDTKAGSLSTLHEQVMQQSNFVNPAMAAALVVKL